MKMWSPDQYRVSSLLPCSLSLLSFRNDHFCISYDFVVHAEPTADLFENHSILFTRGFTVDRLMFLRVEFFSTGLDGADTMTFQDSLELFVNLLQAFPGGMGI